MAKRVKAGSPTCAVAYLRCSTDRQELGPEAQRAAIEAWAARERVTVVAWFTDAVSGGAPLDKRPALVDALAALVAHEAGLLVVQKRDRLARDVLAAVMIEQLVAKSGARVVSTAGEGTEADDPTTVLMRRIVDAFSEYERLVIKARTRAALRVKKTRGEALGEAPYGFAVDGKHLVEDAAEQAVVARVQAWRADGMRLRAIVAALAADGYRSRAGTLFSLTQVARIAARLVAA